MNRRPDIALLSLATTPGLVRSDAAFAELVREAGATCRVVPVEIGASGRLRRQTAVTDLIEALAARRAARALDARAIVFSTVTAALFSRPTVPYAVRFDATAALNRPGPSGAWQRYAERRALRGASLLLPLTAEAEAAIPAATPGPAIRLPIPVERIAPAPVRDIDAAAYAAWPRKRGLELLCAAWNDAAPSGARLVIGGADRAKGVRWLERHGVPEPAGIEWAGELPRERWLEIVARARIFIAASRWEDFGLAPLEALSAGCLLVTVPTPGPYPALRIARELDPELVAPDLSASALAAALRRALSVGEGARTAYADRARELLAPYDRDLLVDVVRETVLPSLR